MKKIVSFLLIITLLLCNGISVLAEEIPTPPSDQISNNPDFAFYEKYFNINHDENSSTRSGEDGLGIIYIQGSISKNDSSSVIITATTTANIICMDIGGSVCIERWYNNEWQTYFAYSFGSHAVSSYSTTNIIPVDSGYYYRIFTTHLAFSLYSTVYMSATSKSIYVN